MADTKEQQDNSKSSYINNISSEVVDTLLTKRNISSFIILADPQAEQIDDIALKCLCNLLEHPECPIKTLIIDHIRLNTQEWLAISKSLTKNLSITCLHLIEIRCHNNITFNPIGNIIIALSNHPHLKTIYIRHYRRYIINDSLQRLGSRMPRSLKQLHISGQAKVDNSIIRVIENNRLETLTVSNWRPLNDFNPNDVILKNRSLIHFVCDNWIQDYRNDIHGLILRTTVRNIVARSYARLAALCLIACRKFRRTECGLLGLVPRELVLQIAILINASYTEPSWHMITESKIV